LRAEPLLGVGEARKLARTDGSLALATAPPVILV